MLWAKHKRRNTLKNQMKAGVMLSYLMNGINIIIHLTYMPVMIRLLGQSEFGLYSLVSGVVSYLSLFSLGFTGAYLRFFSRERQKGDREGLAALNGMFLLLFGVLAAAALSCGLALSCFPRQIFGGKLSGPELGKAAILMRILVVNIALSLIGGLFDAILSAYEQFMFQRTVALLAAVMNPFVCLPLLLMGYGSVMLVVVTTCMTAAKLWFNVWYCFRKLRIPVAFTRLRFSLLKEVGIFSFFLLLNMVIDQINWNVDNIILSHTNGTREVAVYGVASQINSLFMVFSTTISSVFSPRIHRIAAEHSPACRKEFTVLMARIGRIQWMVLGLLAIGFITFGKYFITQIYAGPDYGSAYPAALLLVLPALIPLIQNAGIEMQRALKRHQFRSIVYFLMAIGNIVISIPLARRFGSVGAAMGTAVSLLLANGLIMNIFYHRALKIDMCFFWKEIGKALPGFLAPLGLGVLIMCRVTFGSMTEYVLYVALFTALYCLSVYLFSCNREERALVRGLLGRKRR